MIDRRPAPGHARALALSCLALLSIEILLWTVPSGAAAVPPDATAGREESPETVIVTTRPEDGKEEILRGILGRHWEVLKRLNLVTDDPHVFLRGHDAEGKAWFVEIFTWRSASIPDHAPKEVLDLWAEMNGAVAARGGQPGLDIHEVEWISPGC